MRLTKMRKFLKTLLYGNIMDFETVRKMLYILSSIDNETIIHVYNSKYLDFKNFINMLKYAFVKQDEELLKEAYDYFYDAGLVEPSLRFYKMEVNRV